MRQTTRYTQAQKNEAIKTISAAKNKMKRIKELGIHPSTYYGWKKALPKQKRYKKMLYSDIANELLKDETETAILSTTDQTNKSEETKQLVDSYLASTYMKHRSNAPLMDKLIKNNLLEIGKAIVATVNMINDKDHGNE